MYMKNTYFFAAVMLYAAAAFAEVPEQENNTSLPEPFCEWNLIWNSTWEKTSSILMNRTFSNRGEINLDVLPIGLLFRGQILDRRTLNLDLDNSWKYPVREVTNFTGGLYHKPTGSRLLLGVIDEKGLPARIRNPWIRSPPYPENHLPIIADLRTEPSSTKEDEVYIYLSLPLLTLSPDLRFKCFTSAQTTDDKNSAFSGGFDLSIKKKTKIIMEAFYAEKTLPQGRTGTWFSETPPLPERESRLYAAGFLFKSPVFSVSSDYAMSETFAWGTGFYTNLGLSLFIKPILISFAADGAGNRYVNRDGVNYKEGYRNALKIDLKGRYNSLIRLSTTLRSPAYGMDFNRSSVNFYYRAPVSASKMKNKALWLSRISFYADRNAENPLKINDSFSGYLGFSVSLRKLGIINPLRLNFSGSVKGLNRQENPWDSPSLFPFPDKSWNWSSSSVSSEFIFSYKMIQIRSKAGITFFEEKNENLDFSIGLTCRFKQNRINMKIESPNYPEKWNWAIFWRAALYGKS